LGRRVLAGIVDLILSYILTWPILYTVMRLNVPDWQNQLQNQLLQFYSQTQGPFPDQLLYYSEICLLIFNAVLALYTAGFHAAHGQTPAKALMHVRVVGRDGNNPSLIRALLRGLLFSLSVYLYCFPLLYVLLSPQRRAFHDYAADTCVVEA
jgi:uncharacterized RDD family membrane protein YckC